MKRALVCGAGGFIGHHLVRRLKEEGYWVRGVDRKLPEFSKSEADDFLVLDLRTQENCRKSCELTNGERVDEVYQLAAEMGGMGYIEDAAAEIMRNSVLINSNLLFAAHEVGIKNYFFSSSACVYRDQSHGDALISEEDAYPASPDNDYGWEKLYSERMAYAFGQRYKSRIRVARFQNCYGPEGCFEGGREKAPAALCRKVARADDGGEIEIWGDGSAERTFIYMDDLISGIFLLMRSETAGPINIGVDETCSVRELAEMIASIAGKQISIINVDGPVGVLARYHSCEKIRSLGFQAKVDLREGLTNTYQWIQKQFTERSNRGG